MYYFMIFYFCSFLGLIIETVFSRVAYGKAVSRRTMALSPLCPVYGFGGLFISIICEQLGTFYGVFLGTLAAITAEYIYGIVCSRVFGIVLWDYSECKHNINGLICPQFSFMWLGLTAIFAYVLKSPISFIAVRFPFYAAVLLLVIFMVDIVLTVYLILIGKIDVYCSVIKYRNGLRFIHKKT
mgnify:FL=1